MNVRLIAVDLDGTLLGREPDVIPPENAAALREASRSGIALAFCTGRLPDDASFFALDAKLPAHILSLNGACRLSGPLGRVVRSEIIAPKAGLTIRRAMDALPLTYGLIRNHELVLSAPSISERELAIVWGSHLRRHGGRSVVRLGCEGADALLCRGVNKIVAISERNPAPLLALRERLLREVPDVEVSSSWSNNIEIGPAGVNKGTALAALAGTLAIPMTEVLAVGDNDNDVSMIAAAGIGVAMGNATPAARAAADYVTASNKEGGVALAVRALAFGESVKEVTRLG